MKLIVIEGIDGSGKSTQIKLLRDFLSAESYRCEYLHFPRTDTRFFGELIARFLRGEFGSLNEVDPYLVAMLYAGDRKDASMLISNWLKEGRYVLLDRYTYSNIAYQCAKIDEPAERERLRKWILALEFEHFRIPEPDLNIFLDVPASFTETNLSTARSGNDRSYLNGIRDIHEENLFFQLKVREVYLNAARTDSRLAVVDCSDSDGRIMPAGEIFRKITGIIYKHKLI
ncbi:MAG: dTMP kinase [Bacteroidales bacterium]|nr:dTMP kinase [Bacteroidales bacterium]